MSSTEVKAKVKRQKAKVKTSDARRVSSRLLFTFCLLPFAFFLAACRQDMQDQPRYEPLEPSRFFADGQSSRPLVEGTVSRVPAGQQYVDRQTDYFYTGKMEGAGGATVSGGGVAGTSQGAAAASPNATAGDASMSSQMTNDVNARGNVAGGVPGAREAARTAASDVFPFPVTQEVLDRGQERYNAYCAMCHGMTGEGNGLIVRRGYRQPPSYHEDRLQEGQAAADHFFDVITNGWGAMPSYDYMVQPEDRWKIIVYIRALQLSRRQTLNDLSPEQRAKVLSVTQPHGEGHSGGGEVHGGERH